MMTRGSRMTQTALLKAQRAWVEKYLAERGVTLTKYEVMYKSGYMVKAAINDDSMVATRNSIYGPLTHTLYVGLKAGPEEDWVYPSWVKMPKPKPLLEVGTTVLCTGRVRHNGCRCEVLAARNKVAGSQPRSWCKYRLRCVDERCTWPRKEFSEEIGGRRMQLLELPVTIEMINTQRNTETRRAMIEIYGQGRYLIDAGAYLVKQDDWGKLWRLDQLDEGEPLVMLEMVNSTPEPDGSYSHYFERVPPFVRTPLQALAWQADISPAQYAKMTVQT